MSSKSSREYGKAPISFGVQKLHPQEYCYIQDMPIAFPEGKVKIPSNLEWIRPLVNIAIENGDKKGYIYVTVKRMPVTAGSYITRPGWHCDGFGSNDITYIWSDCYPTEFAVQPFILSDDCDESLKEMQQQYEGQRMYFPNSTLLRLDQFVVHRAGHITRDCVRTFVKITFSDKIFNLEGSAKNYLLNYDWSYQPRNLFKRNHPWGDNNESR